MSIDTQRLELAIRQWEEEAAAFGGYIKRLKGIVEAGSYDHDDLLVELEDDFEEAKNGLNHEIDHVEAELEDILYQLEEGR